MLIGHPRASAFSPPHWLKAWGLCLLMVLPWIAPWSPSPQPNTIPLLVSWACIGLLMVVGQQISTLDIARAWAWAALISSFMGLVQYFGAADVLSPWLHVPTQLGEANANLRQRNQLATLTGIGMLAVLWWRANGLKTPNALWMLALLALGNAATASRTGLLHMLLITGLVCYWSYRSRFKAQHLSPQLAFWALAVYLLGNWTLPWLLSVISGQDMVDAITRMGHNEGCGSRRVLWSNVLHLISQKPWLGWGWEELKYAHYITPYAGGPEDRFCDILGNAHNLPLHFAVTLGIPITTLLGLLVLLLVVWGQPWQSRLPRHQLAWSVLAVIGLHSLLEFPLWYGPFQMAVLLCSVLFIPTIEGFKAPEFPTLRLIGWAVMLAVGLLGADYSRARQIYMPAAERWAFWGPHPLVAARSSWFFGNSATFAQLTMTDVTPQNASWVLATSLEMLHYSPEPRVVEQLIKSAQLLGQHDLADLHRARWLQVFPSLQLTVVTHP